MSGQYKTMKITNHIYRKRKKKSFNFSNEKNGHVALFFKSVNKAAPSKEDFSSVNTMVF